MIRPTQILIWILTFPTVLSVAQGGLYRWEDDAGNVHYSDTVPPSQAKRGHTEISDDGVRLRTTLPAKTAEEIQKEQELEQLRRREQLLKSRQQAADRVLLRTFRSEDDLIMTRDDRIAAIEALIDAGQDNIQDQQEWLGALREEAANLERAGKSVPRYLHESIANVEGSIRDAQAAIAVQEAEQAAIRASFDRDLARFRELKYQQGPRTD
ncbi:MAG: DUF4124 domain-containing protein [Pseudomonadota bacterium]|nr:DUF4124 domain-containing protein [Pseudomonadota bacterium]